MVFLSYRRDDSSGHAGRLYESLAQRLGEDFVFRDTETLTPGEPFPDQLQRRLTEATVVLVLIGRRWMESQHRLADPGDFVRREIEAALARKNVKVIPVLLEGASMPDQSMLPESLRPLTVRHAIDLSEAAYDSGVESIVRTANGGSPGPGRRTWIAAAALALIAAGSAWTLRTPALDAKSVESIRAARELIRTGRANDASELMKDTAPDAAPELREAQEDAAMATLREGRRPPGGTFESFSRPFVLLLMRASQRAHGARKGDLLAHLGWADFLRFRDTQEGNPEPRYSESLATDPANPYGHAMFGHWLLWSKQEHGAAEAEPHFAAAHKSGRQTAWIHHMQLSALMNVRDDHPVILTMMLRTLDEMRRTGQPLPDPSQLSRIHSRYTRAAYSQPQLREAIRTALPPPDHVATLNWLLPVDKAKYGLEDTRAFWMAVLRGDDGDRPRAIEELRALSGKMGTNAPGWVEAAEKEIQRLRIGLVGSLSK